MTGSNGTAAFWRNYSVRNGFVDEPTTTASDPNIEIRLRETEQRLEIAAEWLIDARERIADLERRLAS